MQKQNLATDAAQLLREWILDGRLHAGARLNEMQLADEIEVSRTPIREALNRLAVEDFVRHEPRRGFFVRGVSLEEFDQLYDMRRILDPEALRLAGLPPEETIERLVDLNTQIARSVGHPEKVIELDDAWHLELISGCRNQVLVETIRQFMRRTRRYEFAYMRSGANVSVALDDHEEIIAALRAEDLPRACAGLKRNMTSGCTPLREWLEELNL